MAKSYRLISGAPNVVIQQLALISAQNQTVEGPVEKPILMTSTAVVPPGPGAKASVLLHVIMESGT
jgi:hypothetical protein